MEYLWKYKTPEGFDDLVMGGDDEALTGLWFEGTRDAARRGGVESDLHHHPVPPRGRRGQWPYGLRRRARQQDISPRPRRVFREAFCGLGSRSVCR